MTCWWTGRAGAGPGPETQRAPRAGLFESGQQADQTAARAALNVALGRMMALTFSRSGK
jgi:hypothetical protein